MSMSREDFIALADNIRIWNTPEESEPFTERQIEWLARFCKGQNAAFKHEKWISYIDGGVKTP